MLRVFALISIVIVISSCSSVQADRVTTSFEQPKREISLARENILLLIAMDYESRGWLLGSSEILLELYKGTKNPEYATEYLIVLNKIQQHQKVIKKFAKLNLDGDKNIRELSKALYFLEYLEQAKKEILKIQSPTEADYKVLALIYIQKNDFDSAIKYLTKSYEIAHSPEYLNILTQIYLNLNRVDELLEILENHRKNYKFNQTLSKILGKIYKYQGRNKDALDVYKELYKETEDETFAIQVVETLKNLNRVSDIIKYLEKNRFKHKVLNQLLLELYMSNKLFQKGFDLTKKLYENSKESELLAQNSVFEFELNLQKNIPVIEFLKPVISKLEKVVSELDDPMYYNYLGYLMIDNSYRVQDGVEYVKIALKLKPKSFYMMDSLAWGYHKIGNCQDAFETMSKVVENLGTEDSEVAKHWIEIQKCKKNGK